MSQLASDISLMSVDQIITDSTQNDASSIIINSSRENSMSDASNSSDTHSDMNINQSSKSEVRVDTEDESNLCNETQSPDNWSELPSLSIEKIYSFLSRTDQCRMSQVCQRWSKDYGSPSLWKVIKFYLPEHAYSGDIYPEVRFARKYGSMFRHVEIICKRVQGSLYVIWQQLKFFLQALASESQLMSLKLINIGHYFRFLDAILYGDIFKALLNFFQSQRNFRVVEFRDTNFARQEGVQLLNVLFEACADTLQMLTLRDFVNDAIPTEFSKEYISTLPNVLDKLLNIRSIETDYSLIFEDLMSVRQEDGGNEAPDYLSHVNRKRSLNYLHVFCKGTRLPEFSGIPSKSWKSLVKICPNLRVHLDLTLSVNVQNETEKFIVRPIPITTLDLTYEKPYTSERERISVLFNHLLDCRCNDHLEVVNILWMPTIFELSSSIIPFLQSCSRLRAFHLHTRQTYNGIEEILKSLLEHRPKSLESITFWFNSTRSEEEEVNLAILSEEYYTLLKAEGIVLFFISDP